MIRLTAELASGLKVGHLNVRSLTAHLDGVNLLLLMEQLDVLCLSETWLMETVDTSALLFPGYVIIRPDRRRGKTGGGVAVLYCDKLGTDQLRVPAGELQTGGTVATDHQPFDHHHRTGVSPSIGSVGAGHRQPSSAIDPRPCTRSTNLRFR